MPVQFPQTTTYRPQRLYDPRQAYAGAPQQQMVPQAGDGDYVDSAALQAYYANQQAQVAPKSQNPLQKFWNGLPEWGRWALGITGAVATAYVGYKVGKNASKWPGQIQRFFSPAPYGDPEMKAKRFELFDVRNERRSLQAELNEHQQTVATHEQLLTEKSWFRRMLAKMGFISPEHRQAIRQREDATKKLEQVKVQELALERQYAAYGAVNRLERLQEQMKKEKALLKQIEAKINKMPAGNAKDNMTAANLRYQEKKIQLLKAQIEQARVIAVEARTGQGIAKRNTSFNNNLEVEEGSRQRVKLEERDEFTAKYATERAMCRVRMKGIAIQYAPRQPWYTRNPLTWLENFMLIPWFPTSNTEGLTTAAAA